MRYSRHARQRMAERSISEQDIAAVLESPNVTHPDRAGNPCYIRLVAGRRIRVVIKASDREFVITVVDLDQ